MATMNTTGVFHFKPMLWSSLILIFVVCVIFAAKYTMLRVRVDFAEAQVNIFEEMKRSANETADPQKLSGQLEYVVNYYPSDSKQPKGSRLDGVVETARSNAIGAIISRLRITTGKDLGESPEAWFKEFPPAH